MKNNRVGIFIGMCFLVIISVATTLIFSGLGNLILTGTINGYSASDLAFIKKIMLSKDVLTEKFYENIDEETLFDGAMSGMLAAVDDPYTEYLPEAENKTLEEATQGKYEGVGIVVTLDTASNFPEILYTLPDSPAEKAGIMAEDKIISINEQNCKDMELTEAVELMKVGAGTKLNFVLERSGKNIDISLMTEEIIIKSVYSEIIDGVGYIQITTFDELTSSEFDTEYKKLRDENVKGIILDLRDNGGGIYDEAVKIAKTIVPEGLIVYTEDKNGVRKEERSIGNGIDIPLVVLINENSASASEILAGAIKDRECGTLVGKTTYGKGVVQGWFMIGDGTSIKLTIAKYFTPSGISIEGTGVKPDIEIEEGNFGKDLQMKKALEILKR